MAELRKARMIARLSSTRAGLLCSLLGLSEASINGQPVAGQWTIKDTLAHLASWDGRRSEQLKLAVNNRANEIEPTDTDAINAALFEERHDWTLDEVLQALREGRTNLFVAIEPLRDEDLDRTFALPDGSTTSVEAFVARRYNHDLGHVEPIKSWRKEAARREVGPLPVLAAALPAARAALLAWGTLIPTEEHSTRAVTGEWTWQDVIGHVADWEAWFVRGLQAAVAGRKAGEDHGGVQKWNHEHASSRKGEAYAKTWQDFVSARTGLLDAFEPLDEHGLAAHVDTDVRGFDRVYHWVAEAPLHDYEHVEMLQEALDGGAA